MITSDKVFKMIEKTEWILPFAKHEGALDMRESGVSSPLYSHACGTSHCWGGWFLLSRVWDGNSRFLDTGSSKGFLGGAHLLAQELGFSHKAHLEEWASASPERWGNGEGFFMFCLSTSYGPKAKNLEDVLKHWMDVGVRLLIQELYDADTSHRGESARVNSA